MTHDVAADLSLAELVADPAGGARCAPRRGEHQAVRSAVEAEVQRLGDRRDDERRQRDRPPRGVRLRLGLPHQPALDPHDGPGDGERRDVGVQVEVSLPQRQALTDPQAGAEYGVDDLRQQRDVPAPAGPGRAVLPRTDGLAHRDGVAEPFADAEGDTNQNKAGEPLPYVEPPEGMFPDVRETHLEGAA
nr:hypothetical protein [Isoptericola croceus]